MKKKLRSQVEEHLKQYQLNEGQLQGLLAMQEQAAQDTQENASVASFPPETGGGVLPIRGLRPFVNLASAALFVLAALIGAQTFLFGPVENNMSEAIALEVAKNHIKLKPLEVKTQMLGPIREYFTQLDFSPVKSSLYARRGNSLLGARYCSIAGVTAAQLRYKDSQGQLQTLYEVGYDPVIYGPLPDIDKGEEPLVIMAKGVKTTIWIEKGLLLVSAEN